MLHAPPVDEFPRMAPRRRLLIVLLAVATAVTVVLLMLHPPGGVKRVRPPIPDQPLCTEGQTSGCVGGKAMVIVPAASAPR
jgi:hypothetical protein